MLTAHTNVGQTNTGALACCHGFAVTAGDGPVGQVETPVFSGTSLEPDSLIVRTVDAIPGEFAAVTVAHVEAVDEARRRITLSGTRDELFGADGLRLP